VKLPKKLQDKYESLNEEGRKKLLRNYEESLVAPGEAVGIVAGQSIGEPGTQMILRTHKFAGVTEIITSKGLPRLIEIFDARKTPSTPSMTIYLKKDVSSDEKKVRETATKILELKVKDVLEKLVVDLLNKTVKIYLNKNSLKKFMINTKKVSEMLKKSMKKEEITYEGNVINIKSKDANIKNLYKLRVKVKDVYTQGIPKIEQILPVKKGNEWIIKTFGSNLKEILKVPEVDTTRTFTNDLFEILNILGVEAARNAVINESLMTLKDQGLSVDVRHLMLVADIMTADGTLRGVNRYGVTKGKKSVLARASFEVALKHLFNAAVHREIDELKSIVENVMINQPAPVGTGMLKLVVKHDKK